MTLVPAQDRLCLRIMGHGPLVCARALLSLHSNVANDERLIRTCISLCCALCSS